MEDQKRLMAGSIYYCLDVVSFVSRGHVSVALKLFVFKSRPLHGHRKSGWSKFTAVLHIVVDSNLTMYRCDPLWYRKQFRFRRLTGCRPFADTGWIELVIFRQIARSTVTNFGLFENKCNVTH